MRTLEGLSSQILSLSSDTCVNTFAAAKTQEASGGKHTENKNFEKLWRKLNIFVQLQNNLRSAFVIFLIFCWESEVILIINKFHLEICHKLCIRNNFQIFKIFIWFLDKKILSRFCLTFAIHLFDLNSPTTFPEFLVPRDLSHQASTKNFFPSLLFFFAGDKNSSNRRCEDHPEIFLFFLFLNKYNTWLWVGEENEK